MEHIEFYIALISKVIEAIGVITIFVGTFMAIIKFLIAYKADKESSYANLRQSVGKSILLGLEILIGADIIATVVTVPTLKSVTVLGLIVLIRTFLSISLQVELEGRFPWQQKKSTLPKQQ